MADKAGKRFVCTFSQAQGLGAVTTEIWVDTKTGVNYLFHRSGYGGGLTPLLNRDGAPVITPISQSKES